MIDQIRAENRKMLPAQSMSNVNRKSLKNILSDITTELVADPIKLQSLPLTTSLGEFLVHQAALNAIEKREKNALSELSVVGKEFEEVETLSNAIRDNLALQTLKQPRVRG